MKYIGYTGYEEHRQVHKKLLDKILSYGKDGNEKASDLFGFLVGDWLWKHIMEMDKKILQFVTDNKDR